MTRLVFEGDEVLLDWREYLKVNKKQSVPFGFFNQVEIKDLLSTEIEVKDMRVMTLYEIYFLQKQKGTMTSDNFEKNYEFQDIPPKMDTLDLQVLRNRRLEAIDPKNKTIVSVARIGKRTHLNYDLHAFD